MPFTGRAFKERSNDNDRSGPIQCSGGFSCTFARRRGKGEASNGRPQVRLRRDVRSSVLVLRAARRKRTIPVKTVDRGIAHYNRRQGKTTMIYTHVMNRPQVCVKSPLDGLVGAVA